MSDKLYYTAKSWQQSIKTIRMLKGEENKAREEKRELEGEKDRAREEKRE